MSALPQLKDAVLSLDANVVVLTFERDDVATHLYDTELASIEHAIAWANTNHEASVMIMTGGGSALLQAGNIKTHGRGRKSKRRISCNRMIDMAYKRFRLPRRTPIFQSSRQ